MPIRRSAIAVVVLGLVACGRLGYDPFGGGDDAGGGGDGPRGDGAGPSTPDAGGAPLPVGCVEVTTAADENDPGEQLFGPHLGSGLSLREAIELTDALPGRDCIGMTAPLTITPTGSFLQIDDELDLYGGGSTLVDAPGPNGLTFGLLVNGPGVTIRDLAVADFNVGVELRGADGVVGPGFTSRGCNVGFRFAAARGRLTGARIHGGGGPGVQISGRGGGAVIELSRIHDNPGPGIDAAGITGLTIRHVTVHRNSPGLDFRSNPTGVVVRNLIVSDNNGAGIDVSGATGMDADFVAASGNGGGPCSGCTLGPNSLLVDPRYASDQFDLAADSPLIDRGEPTGLDVNGAAPGLHNGAAPDIGAVER
jgi:hypothetical protein